MKKRTPSPRGPKAGTKWSRRASGGFGFVINHPAETRHVIDRTVGGGVVFVRGRMSRRKEYQETCTLNEWLSWEDSAKEHC